MTELFGLCIMTAQVWGAVIMFGGHKNAPKRLKITIGVFLIFMLFGVIGMANDH